ncbi:hypothetical protein [Actinomadura sp. NPDC049753]|uniref:hypothetical protein n=1 Tax=Actinomadura sp. NPDC049753 TaxID=3154739 RepID=UPI00343CC769
MAALVRGVFLVSAVYGESAREYGITSRQGRRRAGDTLADLLGRVVLADEGPVVLADPGEGRPADAEVRGLRFVIRTTIVRSANLSLMCGSVE